VVGKGLTDSLRAFVEFGAPFLLNPRWHLDRAAILGVTDSAVDHGFTIGLSGLFPR
jgi:hypothetical protein